MKTFVAGVDRLLAIAVGVGLIAGGGFALAWHYDIPWARETLSRFDRVRISELPEQGWWVPTLAVVVCIAVVVALLLLIGNFSPRTTGTASVIEEAPFLGARGPERHRIGRRRGVGRVPRCSTRPRYGNR
ncbi:MAG: hypothetical protein U5N21_02520 [Rhodococcus sp. (in: high G+C Gram-positive bacteria)]|nr:hypothetical protein [Rhodococcus sp. (in: high G+C Gram-positive bacteria)]